MTDIMDLPRTGPLAARRGTAARSSPEAAPNRRLLVVEDDEHFADLLLRLLERDGYTVDLAANGTDALIAGLENAYDAILLDVMMPGPDGFDVVRRLREGLRDVPILMVTARDSVEDRVRGLRSGADDYLVKPFPMADLLARLRAHLQPATAPGPCVLRAGDISLDPITGQVRRAGRLVHLDEAELVLLEQLIRHRGAALTEAQLDQVRERAVLSGQTEVRDVWLRLKAILDLAFGRTDFAAFADGGIALIPQHPPADSPPG